MIKQILWLVDLKKATDKAQTKLYCCFMWTSHSFASLKTNSFSKQHLRIKNLTQKLFHSKKVTALRPARLFTLQTLLFLFSAKPLCRFVSTKSTKAYFASVKHHNSKAFGSGKNTYFFCIETICSTRRQTANNAT